MRKSVNYLRERFLYAATHSGKIVVNENDIAHINTLVDFCNGKPQDTSFEDALLLFYILAHWKVILRHNETLSVEPYHDPGFMDFPDAYLLLGKITMMAEPIPQVIKETTAVLNAHQALNGTPSHKFIHEDKVEEFLLETLAQAKANGFKFFPQVKR